jgi:hypothetical protein
MMGRGVAPVPLEHGLAPSFGLVKLSRLHRASGWLEIRCQIDLRHESVTCDSECDCRNLEAEPTDDSIAATVGAPASVVDPHEISAAQQLNQPSDASNGWHVDSSS